jgi:hypothetical protein
MPALIPTVSIGRLEFDAANRVLSSCSKPRQQQALPYLLSLYAFINWWENYASWGLPATDFTAQDTSGSSDNFWGEEAADLNWAIELSTTWCERPEIVELIDIADLTIQGVTLGIYPVDPQGQLVLHGPTLLGVMKADLCVGVKLDLAHSTARMLGFIPTSDLLTLWQTTPPNAQGFFRLPGSCLQPIHALPPHVSQVQALTGGAHPTHHPEVVQTQPALPRKSNQNNPSTLSQSPNVSQSPDVSQLVQQLKAVGLSPIEESQWQAPTSATAANDTDSQDKASAIHRLITAYQDYTAQTSLAASLKKRLQT